MAEQKSLWREAWRPLFPAAFGLGAAALAAWAATLSGVGPPTAPAAHGALMLFGVYGSAVLGFFLTAWPRQNDAAPPSRGALLAVMGGQGLYLALSVAGWWRPGLAVAAGVVGALVWGAAAVYAVRVAAPSLRRAWDGTTFAAPFAIAAAAAGVALTQTGLAPKVGLALGLHGSLVALALALLDRLLPFFSSKRVAGYAGQRLPGFAPLLLVGVALRVAGAAWPALLPIADLWMVAVVGRQWVGWRPDQGCRLALIAVLHVGVAWIVGGYAIEAYLAITRGDPGTLPVHLWTVGGLGALLVGIATRVSRGHSGGALRLGPDGWAIGALVTAAAGLRAVWPLVGAQPAWAWPVAAGALSVGFGVLAAMVGVRARR